ncbi:MAG TPA: DUF3857 domain-containing protein [Caulobacteraceae bacterium]|nr:DUF3857 domain-containing protein [Caulobacteraceae bacterium]
MRVIWSDTQVSVEPGEQDTYAAFRMLVLRPQGLAVGNLSQVWNPDTDDLTVHELKILRGGETIDVLKTAKFRVVEPEDEATVAVLKGNLAARLQIPDLRVGDQIAFAASLRHRDPVVGLALGQLQMPVVGAGGAFRVTLRYGPHAKLFWKTTSDLAGPVKRETGGETSLVWELRDPAASLATDGAPARYNLRRRIEFSGFGSWAQVSALFAGLFEAATKVSESSPLAVQAEAIAKAHPDARARTEAALELVQDQVRYVFVGLGNGGYRPATAEQTWARRFGDCKAKTALLLALLHRLGVPAEAVLVNSAGGDGTNERLPSPVPFDHVVVRATVDGANWWLDGTEIDAHRLSALALPTFRWALPLRPGGAELEPVPTTPPTLPLMSSIIEVDARAGFAAVAKVHLEEMHRGPKGARMRQTLSALAPADARRTLIAYFKGQHDWFDPTDAAWRYDETVNALVVSAQGEGRLTWDGNDANGRSWVVFDAGFSPPDKLERPAEQDQAAPWSISFPLYNRWTVLAYLPHAGAGRRWRLTEAPVHRNFGGQAFWREAQLTGDVLLSTMSVRSLAPQISASEGRDLNARVADFDNKMSEVAEEPANQRTVPARDAGGAFEQVQNPVASRLLGDALAAEHADRRSEAVIDLDAARALEPESAGLLQSKAALETKIGRNEAALADLEEAHRIDPINATITAARLGVLRGLARTAPEFP